MDTDTPFKHVIVTFDIPALSEYIVYLKDEQQRQQQQKIDGMTKQIAQLTAELSTSSGKLLKSESKEQY